MSYNHQNGEVNLQKLTIFVMMKPSNCIQRLRSKQIHAPRSYSELLTRGATFGVCVSHTHDTFCGTTFAISGKCRIRKI